MQVIESDDFDKENGGSYRTEERPEFLDADCQSIKFEEDYYEVGVISAGG